MSDSPERQRYRLATSQGLTPAPSSKPNPGYAKGGKVMSKKPVKKHAGRGR
jgi:hypothetical protein